MLFIVRLTLLIVCVFCFLLLLNRFRVSHNQWNTKTRDYWYALTMWTFASACANVESIVRNFPGRYSIVFSIAAAIVTLTGLCRRGRWGGR